MAPQQQPQREQLHDGDKRLDQTALIAFGHAAHVAPDGRNRARHRRQPSDQAATESDEGGETPTGGSAEARKRRAEQHVRRHTARRQCRSRPEVPECPCSATDRPRSEYRARRRGSAAGCPATGCSGVALTDWPPARRCCKPSSTGPLPWAGTGAAGSRRRPQRRQSRRGPKRMPLRIPRGSQKVRCQIRHGPHSG